MRTLLFNLSMVMIFSSILAGNKVNGNEKNCLSIHSENVKVEVYYFHYTRRCATCLAVENETQNVLKELYSALIENGTITFQAINLDESDSEEIAKKLEISGQTLLIVSGDNKENITTDAFMNAKSNPDKLKEIIKSTIDPLLEK